VFIQSNYSLDDLRCFCTIVKLGSFKSASNSLNMPLSTLSRRIRQLEKDLQLRLLNRDAHRVTCTHIGTQYFERYNKIFDDINSIELGFNEENKEPKGKIRITAPSYIGKHILKPIFFDFLLKYPEIQLDLRFSNNLIDLEEQGIDVAFRTRNPNIDNWVARVINSSHNFICGQPNEHYYGIKHPKELRNIPKVTCFRLVPWQLYNKFTGEEFKEKPTNLVRLEVDEVEMMIYAVKEGFGISYIPDYIALPMIEKGEIQRILPGWESFGQDFFILYRERNNIPFRVRLFIDYIIKIFENY